MNPEPTAPEGFPHRVGTPDIDDGDDDLYDSPQKQPESGPDNTILPAVVTSAANQETSQGQKVNEAAKQEASQNGVDSSVIHNDRGQQDTQVSELKPATSAPQIFSGIPGLGMPASSIVGGDQKMEITNEREFLEAGQASKGDTNAEWELDSDPESSDDTSSSDSSSEEDSSDDDDIVMSPAEQARMLMEEDEDGGKSAGPPKTVNEVVDEDYKKPEVTVTPDMQITALGRVKNIVDNLILVVGYTSAEYQVLESGSVLCLQDRQVIGVVHEPIGPVRGPLYSVGFSKPSEIAEVGIEEGTEIYYVNQLSSYVFTKPLQAIKGTDASNIHDEEVGANEMEFSDDEAEAEHKRSLKSQKRAARDPQGDSEFQARPSKFSNTPKAPPTSSLDYDDDGDSMYTPLARPDNYSGTAGEEGSGPGARRIPQQGGRGSYSRGHGEGRRGRGDFQRGRGDRGRGGRGDRRGRGGTFNTSERTGGDYHKKRDNRESYGTRTQHDYNDHQNAAPQYHSNPPASNQYPQQSSPVAQYPTQHQQSPIPISPTQPFFNQPQGLPPFPPAFTIQPPSSFPAGAYNPNFFHNQAFPQPHGPAPSYSPPQQQQQQWTPPATLQNPSQSNLQQILAQLAASQNPQNPQMPQQQQHPSQPQQQQNAPHDPEAAFRAAQDLLRRLSQQQQQQQR